MPVVQLILLPAQPVAQVAQAAQVALPMPEASSGITPLPSLIPMLPARLLQLLQPAVSDKQAAQAEALR